MRGKTGLLSAFVFLLVGFGSLGLAGPAWAGDGVVALQTADPSCPDDSANRYVNCGNGTVTDNLTGLTWLSKADCWGPRTWHEAMAIVAGLADTSDVDAAHASVALSSGCDLTDGSSPGEWRLPTMSEWLTMTADARSFCCGDPPLITNDAGDSCRGSIGVGSSFSNVAAENYWTITTLPGDPDKAWLMDLGDDVIPFNCVFPLKELVKDTSHRVWPVRGGQ